MKSITIVKLTLLSLIVASPVTPRAPVDSSTHGVFVATSPCDTGPRSLLQIPETAGCEMIKWRLTLNKDSTTHTPTTYQLAYVYGLPQQNTNGVAQGGARVERTGNWTIVRGTKTSPDAIVYQLDPDKPQASVSLQVSAASPTLTRYVGRSPCQEVARELNKVVNADCMKIKWDLTLYQNPTTGDPTTYKLNGTFYRKRIGEGNWAIIKGIKTNPDAVVYQLDPDKSQGTLFFLKADDNILFFLSKEKNLMVGNGDFSYTLNKADALKH